MMKIPKQEYNRSRISMIRLGLMFCALPHHLFLLIRSGLIVELLLGLQNEAVNDGQHQKT